MNTFLHLKKLHQNGFDHVLLGVAFAVVIGVAGSYYLLATQAAPWSGGLQIGASGTPLNKASLCMDNESDSNTAYSTVDLYKCNGTQAQNWTKQSKGSSSEFQLVAAASKACVDDTAGEVGTNPGNRAYIQTWPCNSNDTAQLWKWNGHQIQNVRSGGCINDPGNATSGFIRLIVYSCNGSPNNAQWFEIANSGSTGSGSGSGGGNGGAYIGKDTINGGTTSTGIVVPTQTETVYACKNVMSSTNWQVEGTFTMADKWNSSLGKWYVYIRNTTGSTQNGVAANNGTNAQTKVPLTVDGTKNNYLSFGMAFTSSKGTTALYLVNSSAVRPGSLPKC